MPVIYKINLVRTARQEEKKAQVLRSQITFVSAICFGLLGIAVLYAAFDIVRMNMTIAEERQKLARVEAEYHKYKETKMTVDKADIELLDQIQHGRIFWTKKLAAMAHYLPDNYWITAFDYHGTVYKVNGYGYITTNQEQLITLDDYLNSVRADTLYNDVLTPTYLKSTTRQDEEGKERVSFEYTSYRKGAVR